MAGRWTLKLKSYRDHETELTLKDEAGALLNLTGWVIKFVVTDSTGSLEWSTTTGHVVIATPATLGKATLTVPREEIEALTFEWAAFDLHCGPDADTLDLVYSGKAQVT